jgi:hypothetical protein
MKYDPRKNQMPYGGATDIFGNIVWVVTKEEHDALVDKIERAFRKALSDKDYRDQVITQALREAESWRARYEKYAELAEICDAIMTVKVKLEPKQEKPEKKKVEA